MKQKLFWIVSILFVVSLALLVSGYFKLREYQVQNEGLEAKLRQQSATGSNVSPEVMEKIKAAMHAKQAAQNPAQAQSSGQNGSPSSKDPNSPDRLKDPAKIAKDSKPVPPEFKDKMRSFEKFSHEVGDIRRAAEAKGESPLEAITRATAENMKLEEPQRSQFVHVAKGVLETLERYEKDFQDMRKNLRAQQLTNEERRMKLMDGIQELNNRYGFGSNPDQALADRMKPSLVGNDFANQYFLSNTQTWYRDTVGISFYKEGKDGRWVPKIGGGDRGRRVPPGIPER